MTRTTTPRGTTPATTSSADPAPGAVSGIRAVVQDGYGDVGVLRPGGLVNVRGAGRLFNGSYFVTRVQHVIDAGGYVQSFEAERNAVTMTGAELYVLP